MSRVIAPEGEGATHHFEVTRRQVVLGGAFLAADFFLLGFLRRSSGRLNSGSQAVGQVPSVVGGRERAFGLMGKDNGDYGPRPENYDLLEHISSAALIQTPEPQDASGRAVVAAFAEGLAAIYSNSLGFKAADVVSGVDPSTPEDQLLDEAAKVMQGKGIRAGAAAGEANLIVRRILEAKAVVFRAKRDFNPDSGQIDIVTAFSVGSESGSGRVYVGTADFSKPPGQDRFHDVYADVLERPGVMLDNGKHLWVEWDTPPLPSSSTP